MGTVDPMRWPWRRERSDAWGKYLARVGSDVVGTPRHVRVVGVEELAAEGYELDDDSGDDDSGADD